MAKLIMLNNSNSQESLPSSTHFNFNDQADYV